MIRLFLRPFDERGTALGLLFARYSSSRSAATAVSACGLPGPDCRSAPGGPSFIDIGANLLGEQFSGIYRGARKHEPDMRAILDRSSRAGLTHIMITASNLRDSIAALSMIRSHAAGGVRLFTTVGVHPTNTRRELEDAADGEHPTPCGDADAYFSALDAVLADGVSDGSVVAIGEAGLDFEPDREKMSPRAVQLRHFPRHFALAEKYGLPIFFHERDASEDFLRIVSENRSRFRHGVVHSYTGSKEAMHAYCALGLFIGLNGCSLKTEENLRVVREVPLDHLMLETDAPYCGIGSTSQGFKHVKTFFPEAKPDKFEMGRTVKGRTEPSHIVQVAEVVAAVKGIPVSVVAAAAHANALRVFFPPR